MELSLDEFIKARKGAGRTRSPTTSSPTQTSTPSPLENSLDSIIEARHKQSHRHHNNRHSNSDGHGHVRRTSTTNKRQYNTYDANKSLLITVQNNHPRYHQHPSYGYNTHSYGGGYHQGRSNYNNPHNNYALTQKKIGLSAKIDHSLFDPRGIRDYSQAGARRPKYGRHGFYDIEDLEEYGATLRIKNIAPSVTLADIGRAFGVIGPVKDFDLLTHLTPFEAIVTYRRRLDAMAAMERYNGTELDGSELKITLELSENSKSSSTSTTPTTTKSDGVSDGAVDSANAEKDQAQDEDLGDYEDDMISEDQ